jgi:hypothetical protein
MYHRPLTNTSSLKIAAAYCTVPLKVPKREIFVSEYFTISDPIGVGEMGTGTKNQFF